jgi:hypothetical protein
MVQHVPEAGAEWLPKISAAGWAAVFVNSFSPEWPPCSLEIWSQGNSLGKSPPAGRLCVQRIRFNAKSAPRAPFFLCSLQALLGDSTGVLGEVEAVVGCSSVPPPSASSVPTVWSWAIAAEPAQGIP